MSRRLCSLPLQPKWISNCTTDVPTKTCINNRFSITQQRWLSRVAFKLTCWPLQPFLFLRKASCCKVPMFKLKFRSLEWKVQTPFGPWTFFFAVGTFGLKGTKLNGSCLPKFKRFGHFESPVERFAVHLWTKGRVQLQFAILPTVFYRIATPTHKSLKIPRRHFVWGFCQLWARGARGFHGLDMLNQ